MSARRPTRIFGACPAVYAMSVAGRLEGSWSPRLGGLDIMSRDRNGHTISTLVGNLTDQSALLGVLSALCSLGLPLQSVELIGEDREVLDVNP